MVVPTPALLAKQNQSHQDKGQRYFLSGGERNPLKTMTTIIAEHINSQPIEIRVGGKSVLVPSASVQGRKVITTRTWPAMAAVFDESLVEGTVLSNPESFVSDLRETNLKADIFTFAQKVPDTTPRYKYYLEWDNVAAIPITTYSNWLKNRVEHDVRSAIKKSVRLGVIVRVAEFDDSFVEGIKGIYDESPIRQGKPFWHYHKDLGTIKQEASTYLERSTFVGAYYGNELIGFLKLVLLGKVEAVVLYVISQQQHSNKKPTSALLAKAVEICEQRGIAFLTYGRYAYRGETSSLTEFKRRNGFEKILLPRYYIPLTTMGSVALKLNLHHQLADWLPKCVMAQLRRIRTLWYSRRAASTQEFS